MFINVHLSSTSSRWGGASSAAWTDSCVLRAGSGHWSVLGCQSKMFLCWYILMSDIFPFCLSERSRPSERLSVIIPANAAAEAVRELRGEHIYETLHVMWCFKIMWFLSGFFRSWTDFLKVRITHLMENGLNITFTHTPITHHTWGHFNMNHWHRYPEYSMHEYIFPFSQPAPLHLSPHFQRGHQNHLSWLPIKVKIQNKITTQSHTHKEIKMRCALLGFTHYSCSPFSSCRATLRGCCTSGPEQNRNVFRVVGDFHSSCHGNSEWAQTLGEE